MLYRMLTATIALLAIVVLANGCGSGSGSISTLGTSAVPSSASLEIQYSRPSGENGLRQRVHYSYDYSTFQQVEGFALVPMMNERIPDYDMPDAFTMQVEQDGADRYATCS